MRSLRETNDLLKHGDGSLIAFFQRGSILHGVRRETSYFRYGRVAFPSHPTTRAALNAKCRLLCEDSW